MGFDTDSFTVSAFTGRGKFKDFTVLSLNEDTGEITIEAELPKALTFYIIVTSKEANIRNNPQTLVLNVIDRTIAFNSVSPNSGILSETTISF